MKKMKWNRRKLYLPICTDRVWGIPEFEKKLKNILKMQIYVLIVGDSDDPWTTGPQKIPVQKVKICSMVL